jgi:AAA domain
LIASTKLEKPKEALGLIPNRVPSQGTTLLYGPPKCGKSFLALDWSCRVVTGTPYRGLAVRQGPVVYLAQEGQGGFWQRKEAWFRFHGRSPLEDQLNFIMIPVKFLQRAKQPVEVELVKAIRFFNVEPALIVVDTVAKTMDGNENDTEHASFFMKAVEYVGNYFKAPTILVHHQTKSGDDPRGSVVFAANADAQIKVGKRTKPGIVKYRVDYMKDGPGEDDWNVSNMHIVDVDEFKSCVLEHTQGKEKYTEEEQANVVTNFVKPHLTRMFEIAKAMKNGRADFPFSDFKDVCLRTNELYRKGTRDIESREKSFRNRLLELKELRLLEQDGDKLRLLREEI